MNIKDFISNKLEVLDLTKHGERQFSDWLFTFYHHQNIDKQIDEIIIHGQSEATTEDVIKIVNDLLKVPYIKHYRDLASDTYSFLTDNSFCYVGFALNSDMSKNLEVRFLSTDKQLVTKIEEEFKKLISKKKTDGVYVISTRRSGLTLHSLGKLDYKFTRENYEPNVVKSYDYIVSEYNKENPHGRLTIINGVPGTGKTHFTKGIISEIKDSLIILLPSKSVADVDSPALVSLLTDEKYDKYSMLNDEMGENTKTSSMPIVFVIEDGDACLVPRDSNNVSLISSLLNYTDGIFGSMLDLRIIVTTNAEKMEFDEALLRPGRLCRHVTVGELSPDRASVIYKRLTNKDKEYKKKVTLARVYADAQGTFEDPELEENVVGFGK